jgi:hypothetical protein
MLCYEKKCQLCYAIYQLNIKKVPTSNLLRLASNPLSLDHRPVSLEWFILAVLGLYFR